MRILVVNHTLGPPAGSEKNTFITATGLHKRGHIVQCFGLWNGQTAYHLETEGIGCWEKDPTGLDKPDIIFAGHKTPTRVIAKHFPDTPMVVISRSTYNDEELLGEDIFKRAHSVVAVDTEVKEHLDTEYGFEDDKVVVIRNSVDLTWYRPETCHYRWREGDPIRIVQVSRIGGKRQYGINTMIKVAAELNKLHDERHGADYMLAGFGHWHRIYALEEELGIQVLMQHQVWDSADTIHQGDMVAGAARCIMEGMACGKPCIPITNFGCDGFVTRDNFEEVHHAEFHGKTQMFPLNDPTKIAIEIKKTFNSGKYKEMCKTNRALAETHFDNEIRLNALEHLFEEAIKHG